MTELHAQPASAGAIPGPERRAEPREPVGGMLWLIDHEGETVLRCHCIEGSGSGMRLRVPLGYGIAEGQRYELRSHLPGTRPVEGFGLIGSRWATVVRTDVCTAANEHHLEVGVVFDLTDRSPLTFAETTQALV